METDRFKTAEQKKLDCLDADGITDYILSLGMQATEIEQKNE